VISVLKTLATGQVAIFFLFKSQRVTKVSRNYR